MAKKETTTEHYAYLLIDPVSGLTVVYSSEEGAEEDKSFFQSHTHHEGMSVMKIPFVYDRMDSDLRMGLLTDMAEIL